MSADLAALEAFGSALPLGIEAACNAALAAHRAVGELGADEGRAVRAAMLLASGEKRPYRTDLRACSCPDAFYHFGRECYHMLALRLGQVAEGARP